ncbi:hypothetical protein V6N12_059244 [Hibiscus sabdariffa]|uniref:Uncharacterized protein n=1 Tax=Hibiscus sabdariffa TaxID=183260 RepID=A0ABR2EUH9_9ROSI
MLQFSHAARRRGSSSGSGPGVGRPAVQNGVVSWGINTPFLTNKFHLLLHSPKKRVEALSPCPSTDRRAPPSAAVRRRSPATSAVAPETMQSRRFVQVRVFIPGAVAESRDKWRSVWSRGRVMAGAKV